MRGRRWDFRESGKSLDDPEAARAIILDRDHICAPPMP
jgi:hypothetical protein